MQTRCQEYQETKPKFQGGSQVSFGILPYKVNVCGPSNHKYLVLVIESFIPVMVRTYSYGLMRISWKSDKWKLFATPTILGVMFYLIRF